MKHCYRVQSCIPILIVSTWMNPNNLANEQVIENFTNLVPLSFTNFDVSDAFVLIIYMGLSDTEQGRTSGDAEAESPPSRVKTIYSAVATRALGKLRASLIDLYECLRKWRTFKLTRYVDYRTRTLTLLILLQQTSLA
ncbi:hypothetical protein DY000_02044613 [Brassica cretica]|uniref:Uncharacterized protein n=1 Tax=Brassica cretica TaxID=69181 RepID=A0ABQ7ENN9_BRACR|nr:hypothetical protein DY000_02044613 [Brassica cretica]